MAFIYRYKLRNNKGGPFSFTDHEAIVTETIESLFGNRVKDLRVEADFFEFKLYESANYGVLRTMGRKLASGFRNMHRDYPGCIRISQKFYAIIYPPEYETSKQRYLEFVDVEDIEGFISEDMQQTYHQRALEYARKVFRNESNWDADDYINRSHYNAFYLDVTSGYYSSDCIMKENLGTDIILFKICGNHIRSHSLNSFEKENIVKLDALQNVDLEYVGKREGNDILSYSDYIKITSINRVKNSEVKLNEINKNFKNSLTQAKEIEAIKNCKNKSLNFMVHNVGQGLSTSLSYANENNFFLFFDFGMAEGLNYFTLPNEITGEASQNSTIILSHIHGDHWSRLALEKEAFKSKWIIPPQNINLAFNKKCSEIILSGGSVQVLGKSVIHGSCTIFCGGIYKLNPLVKAVHNHETGLGMRIQGKNGNGEPVNILVPGDQRFDFIEDSYLSDIDILVASHHGGVYSRTRSRKAYMQIPESRNEKYSKVIYSYGLKNGRRNTHNHPSKTDDYTFRKWYNRHDTPVDGDYSINIIFN